MSEHIINNNVSLNLPKSCMDDSPCLVCPHRDTEGNDCALLCLRLAAHSSGEPWEDKPLPYIAKQKTRKSKKGKDMENNTEAKDQKPICEMPDCSESAVARGLCQKDYDRWRNGEIEHPRLGVFSKKNISVEKGICVFDECDEKAKIRGCCSPHYQAWRKGYIEHPVLGVYTTSQAKSRLKKPKPDHQPQKPQAKSSAIKPNNPVTKPYPPPSLITLDLSKYPEIRNVIFDTAKKFLLPVEHVVMTLVGEAIAGKKQIKGV